MLRLFQQAVSHQFPCRNWHDSKSVSNIPPVHTAPRRGGRVADCTGLENRQGRKFLVGSNPTLSVSTFCDTGRQGELSPVAPCVFGDRFRCFGDRTGSPSPSRVVTTGVTASRSGTPGSATFSATLFAPVSCSAGSAVSFFAAVGTRFDRFREPPFAAVAGVIAAPRDAPW